MDTTWRVFSGEEGRRNRGEKVQGRRSINTSYKIDSRRLVIVWDVKKPKYLHVRPIVMS